MEQGSITRSLSEWAAEKTWESVPPRYQREAVDSLVDTVGVGFAGSVEDGAVLVRRFMTQASPQGSAEIWGSGGGVSAATAAYVNGVAAHILDFDDVSYALHGHPSCVLYPALFAAGQEYGVPGARILEGYVVGVGVMTAVKKSFGDGHYSRGWHSTSTCGAIGAAAGVARSLGMSAPEIAAAIGAAVSMAAGVRANFGTMMKSVHSGMAARAGVEAALMVRSGLTSSPSALEDRLGGIALFGDASWVQEGEASAAALRDTAEHALESKGLKRYPCCGGSHFGVDAALEVRAQLPAGAEIESVRVDIPSGARTALIHDDPSTGLEAKFSLPYTVALSLAHGVPEMSHFTDSAVQDERTRHLMSVMTVHEDSSGGSAAGSLDARYAEVTVRTTTGDTLTHRVHHPRGTANRPLTSDEVDQKFLSCAAIVTPDPQSEKLLERLRDLGTEQSVRGLFADVATPAT
jgi:2-methylcitrate dehydratase PrpD